METLNIQASDGPANSDMVVVSGLAPASLKRRLLGVYLDYLFIGVPLALIGWASVDLLESRSQLSSFDKFVIFFILEIILLKFVRWSFGFYCLGMFENERLNKKASEILGRKKRVFLVDDWLLSNERWWTMFFGVAFILEA